MCVLRRTLTLRRLACLGVTFFGSSCRPSARDALPADADSEAIRADASSSPVADAPWIIVDPPGWWLRPPAAPCKHALAATIRLPSEVGLPEIQHASATACRNGDCATTRLASLYDPLAAAFVNGVRRVGCIAGPLAFGHGFTAQLADCERGAWSFVLTYDPPANSAVADGDRYSLDLRSSEGARLTHWEYTARYLTNQLCPEARVGQLDCKPPCNAGGGIPCCDDGF